MAAPTTMPQTTDSPFIPWKVDHSVASSSSSLQVPEPKAAGNTRIFTTAIDTQDGITCAFE